MTIRSILRDHFKIAGLTDSQWRHLNLRVMMLCERACVAMIGHKPPTRQEPMDGTGPLAGYLISCYAFDVDEPLELEIVRVAAIEGINRLHCSDKIKNQLIALVG